MHNHRCVVCGFTWDCTDPTWGKRSFSKCGVTHAAKVNGTGPYCIPCREAEMKRRVAFVEGMTWPDAAVLIVVVLAFALVLGKALR